MSKENNKGCTIRIGSWKMIIFGIPTAIIGHAIHGSVGWAIFDLFFWPLVWFKWLICKDVTLAIIEGAFEGIF